MLSFRYLGTSICFSLIGVTLSCLHPTRKMKIIAPVQEDALLPYAYPETPKGTESDLYFGQRVDDPYRWLEDGSSPEVKNWVAAQEAFTAHYFANPGLETLRTKIKKRLEEVLDYTKIGLPQKHGAYIYYWKHEGLKPQDVYYRKNIENASALEEIVLDPNTFSANGTVAASPVGFDKNHRYMVYSVSSAGSDWQHFAVRDLHSLRDLDDKVAWIKFSAAAFAGDGFYYQRFPEPQPGDELSGLNQNAAVYYHRLGEPQSADRKIFANPLVPQNTFGVSSSDDESYLIITENKGTYQVI
jgi:prolyl oligopeptidase